MPASNNNFEQLRNAAGHIHDVDFHRLLSERDVEVAIVNEGEIMERVSSQTSINNPYNFDVNRFLPNAHPMTLEVFFHTACRLIKDAQLRAGVNEEDLVHCTEEYPPLPFEGFGDELIAFKLISRTPGMMNTKGTGRPHRKATYWYDLVKPEYPNKTIIVESRPVDHVIEFCCYGRSNKLVNKRAIWLERLFVNSAFAFEVKGAERFYWKERKADTYINHGEQRIFCRPIHFFLRFREFEAKAESILRRIIIEATANAGE